MDAAFLARLQFAVTIAYHFLFVPLSIGVGLLVVLAERRYYKSGAPEDQAASDLWIKLFTATFAVGVATGIAMEFAFGTNWATYSRFVGDIFGAPLAAEALFAFFLESTFLAVLLFGRSRVSKRFYYTSTWLVWGGSMLSALWIIIANSWMQSPAGYKIVVTRTGPKAVLTNFFAAAFNPTMVPRYIHVIVAVLMMGGFAGMGVAAYYLRKGTFTEFARTTMRVSATVAIVFSVLMLPAGHLSAVSVFENQATKLAAMEGMWMHGPAPLGIVGFVDTSARKTYAIEIPGMVSFLATGSFRKPYLGLNEFPPAEIPTPRQIQITYQSYHLMILLWGFMIVVAAAAWWFARTGALEAKRRFLTLLVWSPLAPLLAIQLGWVTAEVGRQPWIVWHQLKTVNAISRVVPSWQIVLTLVLFTLFYTLIYVAWARVVAGFIKRGPEPPEGAAGAPVREPAPVPSGTLSGAVSATSPDSPKGVS